MSRHAERILNGRYLLADLLAENSAAKVFRALDVSLQREVAVKLLRLHTLDETDFLGRFKYHAQLVAQLNHTGIEAVYDWDVDESPYLVTELCRGGSLRAMLENLKPQTLNPSQVIAIGIQAGTALNFAHQKSMIHKGLRPTNILFDSHSGVKLTDFGFAHILQKKSLPGISESLAGASYYSAPEQLTDKGRYSEKSDIYSLALILLKATLGKLPVADDTNLGSYITRMTESLQAPEELGGFGEILTLALKKDPAQRPSANEFVWYLQGLEEYKQSVPLPLASPPVMQKALKMDAVGRAAAPADRKSLFVRGSKKGPLKKGKSGSTPPAKDRDRDASFSAHKALTLSLSVAVVLAAAAFSFSAFLNWVWWSSSNPAVPDLVDASREELDQSLSRLEKNWQAQEFEMRDENVPAGQVISVSPPPGTNLKKGSPIEVTVSLGEPLIVLPVNLLGSTLEEIGPRLSGLGLKMGEVSLADGSLLDSPGSAGYVVVGFNEPTAEVPHGAEISLVVRQA